MELISNPQAILSADFDLATATLFGVKLGDAASSIPREVIDDKDSGRWISTKSGMAYYTDEGLEGKVIGFSLDKSQIGLFGIEKETDIEVVFGKPEGLERSNGSHYYFYPARSIVVFWNARDAKINAIQLGDVYLKQTTYNAVDLLNSFMAYRDAIGKRKDWLAQARASGGTENLRLREFGALLEAFGFGTDASPLGTGSFLDSRTEAEMEPLLSDVAAYMEERGRMDEFDDEAREEILRMSLGARRIYTEYLRLIKAVHRIASFNSGYLSIGLLSSEYIITRTNAVLKTIDFKQLDRIKAMLGKLIDPAQRSFTQSELVRNFGFPEEDVDLKEMDDW